MSVSTHQPKSHAQCVINRHLLANWCVISKVQASYPRSKVLDLLLQGLSWLFISSMGSERNECLWGAISLARTLINERCTTITGFPGGSVVKNPLANEGDMGSIPGSGISPGEGNGNPLQYPCLGNCMDRGSGLAIVHGVAKNRTQLIVWACTYDH